MYPNEVYVTFVSIITMLVRSNAPKTIPKGPLPPSPLVWLLRPD